MTPALSLVPPEPVLWTRYREDLNRTDPGIRHLQPISPFSPVLPPRATQARVEAAGEAAAARQVEAGPGTRTTRSPLSPHPTTPSPLLFTWWSTTPRATSATRCHTTGSSTRTRTRSCPRSWCPTCWRRRAISFPTRCPRWVDTSQHFCNRHAGRTKTPSDRWSLKNLISRGNCL